MSTADATTEVRPFLAALVEREVRRTGSKMAAYAAVAKATGISSSWIRKVLGRQEGLGLSHRAFVAVAALYVRVCERVEAEAEIERRKFLALKGHANAVVQGRHGLDLVANTDGDGPLSEGEEPR